jgi:uncharacterized protein
VYAEGGILDLERLALSSGQARSLDLEVELDPIELGGQTYAAVGGRSETRLDVSRTTSGYALRLRFGTQLTGPCVRCLEQASAEIELDVHRWANDALVLALPDQLLCRPDCAGLCPVCGESLNDTDPEAHRHSQGGDPRMAKLRDLRLD